MTIEQFPHFTPLALEHKDRFEELFRTTQPRISEFTFTNLFMWRHHYGIDVASYGDGLLCLAKPNGNGPFFFPPIGVENPPEAVKASLKYLEHEGHVPVMKRVDQTLADRLAADSGQWTVESDRDQFDYVYAVEDLVSLSGRKYHRKKNHLNKFLKNYPFEYRPLGEELLEGCFKLVEEWCIVRKCDEYPALAGEERAIRELLMNLDRLSCRGAALMVEDRVEAFTLGEALNQDTVVIHIEKANADTEGAYAAMNQQFLEHEWSGFTSVNREQDMGEEGLRKAKESYLPTAMVEKYSVRPAWEVAENTP